MQSLQVVPTGCALGAEIRGVDLAQPIDAATFQKIENVLLDEDASVIAAHNDFHNRRPPSRAASALSTKWSRASPRRAVAIQLILGVLT